MKNKRIVLIIALAVVGATAAGFWFLWQNKQKVVPGSQAQTPAEEETLGGALFQGVEQQQNPFKQTPEVTPLPAGTNPFKDAYRNPFDQ